MKLRAIFILLAIVFVAAVSPSQSLSAKPGNANLIGVWRAQMNGLPVFSLVITDESGGLSGAILFYTLKREDMNHPFTATPGLPEPIFNLKFDGKTLTFQVSHRRAHPPRTLSDPPVTFDLTLTEDGKAQLINRNEVGTIAITRSDY